MTWRVIPHGLCAEMGWDGDTVASKGITVGCPHEACGSTCVPSDAPEQMLPSARGEVQIKPVELILPLIASGATAYKLSGVFCLEKIIWRIRMGL